MKIFKPFILILIRFYQKTISPDHSRLGQLFPFVGCCFYPTCSQYTYQMIEKYGFWRGSYLGLKRILKCR